MNVSVVIPAYNCAETVGACIESLLSQDYPGGSYEIIVIDNNSSDATASVVEDYAVKLAFEKERQSPGAARNRGISLAQYGLIAFIDSDCLAEPGWLSNLIAPFGDPGVGLVGGRIKSQVPASGLVETFLTRVKYTSADQYASSEPMGLPSGNVAYRRECLQKIGMFDGAMPWGEDIDLAWRAQVYGGYRAVFEENAVVYHKHRSTLAGLFNQFRKYGTVEMVLSTLYLGQEFHRRTPSFQLRGMAAQLRSLLVYPFSFVVRLFRRRRWESDRLYLFWPLLWLVLDSGYLLGKLEGLVKTRFFRRNPYPTDPQEVRRDPVVQIAISHTKEGEST